MLRRSQYKKTLLQLYSSCIIAYRAIAFLGPNLTRKYFRNQDDTFVPSVFTITQNLDGAICYKNNDIVNNEHIVRYKQFNNDMMKYLTLLANSKQHQVPEA